MACCSFDVRSSWLAKVSGVLVLALAFLSTLSAQVRIEASGALAGAVLSNADTPNDKSSAVIPSPAMVLSPEQMGDLHMAHKRYQAAIEAYHRTPLDTAVLWNKLGIASQQMLLLADAQKEYENSLKLDPKSAEVLNNLGTVYFSLKQYGRAEKLYKSAIKLTPKSALIYKNLGTAYLAENKLQKGWQCFQTALQIDPQVLDGRGHFRIGNPTPASQLGAMNYFLARSYTLAGNTDRAIEYLRMSLAEGYTDRKRLLADREFSSLHELPAFQLLLSEQSM